MTFRQLAESRYSVRSYSSVKPERELINDILETGRLAPTARNNQPQKIYVLESEDALRKIRDITPCAFNAPVVLMVCGKSELAWKNQFSGKNMMPMDIGIVTTHMMLRAAELGLGSCWVGYFDPDAASRAFALPDDVEPLCLLPLGYPAEDSVPSERHADRKPLSETVEFL